MTQPSSSAPAQPEQRLPADPSSAGALPAGVGAPAKAASLLLVVGFSTLVVCLLLLGTLSEGIRDKEVFALDTLATPFLHGLASPGLDTLMNDATTIGSITVIPILYALAMIALIAMRRLGAALFLTVASGGALLINQAMKLFFQRPRPQLEWSHVLPDYSFPSGHTMDSVAFYGALAVIVWSIAGRRWGITAVVGAVVLSTLIGVSRIYLGYHYFTDVVGGALAGISWLLITVAAFRIRPLSGWWISPTGSGQGRSGPSTGRRS